MTKGKSKFIILSLMIPALVLYSVFLVLPLVQGVIYGFFEWNGIPSSPMIFVGLDNFKQLFQSSEFPIALKNSGWFVISGLLVQMPLAFILAMIITSRIKGVRFFKTAFFIPVILPMTAVGLMWTFILYPNGGLLNTLLETFGLGFLVREWLGDPSIAIFTVVLVSAWIYSGINMIIFASGLVAIPEDIYQSAAIDGAVGFKKLLYITVPMMTETIKIYFILCLTGALKVFDIIFVMTRGGPNGATEVPATLLYNQSFMYNHFGLGSSMGIFILFVGLSLSALLNKLLYSDVN